MLGLYYRQYDHNELELSRHERTEAADRRDKLVLRAMIQYYTNLDRTSIDYFIVDNWIATVVQWFYED